jgi:hypothetical protein
MGRNSKPGQRIGIAPVAASRQGHDYQDLYGWWRALDLLRPLRRIARVSIEDPSAGSFDDVTIRIVEGASRPNEFVQVKFHVNEAGAYSTDALMAKGDKGRSLLEKAWKTWQTLIAELPNLELVLVSTYSWDHADPVAPHIRKRNATLDAAFIEGAVVGKVLAARTAWKEHLGDPDEAEFQEFLGTLRFRLGFDATTDLMLRTGDVMEAVGLKGDEESVLRGARQIHDWINEGRSDVTADEMQEAIERLDLRQPGASPEPGISFHVYTIVKEPPETAADWELDWRDHFEGGSLERGHQILEERLWNEVMLPELASIRADIQGATATRLLRVAGKARLSVWFAVGWAFQRQAGWILEIDQNGSWWRNDTPAADDIDLVTAEEDRGGDPDTIAVGLSITGDLAGDVRKHLAATGEPAGKLLLVQLSTEVGLVVRGPADAVRLAERLREAIKVAAGGTPKRLLLFYFGPLAGAAFIGARLNAVAREIQIFEDQVGSYAPSFSLKQG